MLNTIISTSTGTSLRVVKGRPNNSKKSERAAFSAANKLLNTLSAERESWEATEFAQSRARLYRILTSCYSFYRDMIERKDENTRKQMREALETFTKRKGYKFKNTTGMVNRVVQSVFGNDMRRVSGYAAALRVAMKAMPGDKPVDDKDLAGWIEKAGGVEEIRTQTVADSGKREERLQQAVAHIAANSRQKVTLNTKAIPVADTFVDQVCVFIGVYRADATLQITGVVQAESVRKMALNAYYNENKQQIEAAKAGKKAKSGARAEALKSAAH